MVAFVDHQALDLEELGGMTRVDRLVAEDAPGQQRPDRRPMRLHHPDLERRRVGPQEVAGDVDVEGVPQVAGRMVGCDVEHLEVGQVVLDLRSLVDDEAEPTEDLGDPAHRLDDRMEGASADRPTRRGHVERLPGEAVGQLGGPQPRATLGKGGFDRCPDLVGDRADPRPVVGWQAADSRAGPR